MGGLGGLLGVAGGAGGSGFAAPSMGANPALTNPNLSAANQAAIDANAQQAAFTKAVQPGGLAALQSQQQLLGQLGQGAQGQGPNPALAQLNQATAANTANQAALMAGQRGAGQNAGLIARQAAQQGASNQQQAAGQAATLSAQQQIAYMQQLQQQQAQMANQQAAATNAQAQTAQGQQLGLTNAAAGLQSNINSANAGLAGQTMGANQGLLGGVGNAVSGAIGSLFADGGAVIPNSGQYDQNFTPMSDQQYNQLKASNVPPSALQPTTNRTASPAPQTPASIPQAAPTITQTQVSPQEPQSTFGKFMKAMTTPGNQSQAPQGANQLTPQQQTQKDLSQTGQNIGNIIGKGIGNLFKSSQSTVSTPAYAPGSEEDKQSGGLMTMAAHQQENQESGLPLYSDVLTPEQQQQAQLQTTGNTQNMSASNDNSPPAAAEGGRVDALVSPGEQYLPPKAVKKVLKDGKNPLSVGERIPGKPKFKGNDYRNDTVPKKLEEGGVVIPNEVMQKPNAHWEAMKFVHAHMAKSKKGLPSK